MVLDEERERTHARGPHLIVYDPIPFTEEGDRFISLSSVLSNADSGFFSLSLFGTSSSASGARELFPGDSFRLPSPLPVLPFRRLRRSTRLRSVTPTTAAVPALVYFRPRALNFFLRCGAEDEVRLFRLSSSSSSVQCVVPRSA